MMTWNDMVQKYPNQWVVIKNAVMDGPDIISGEVFAVKTDDEIIDFRDNHSDINFVYRRTKGGISNGPIQANFIVQVD